MEVRPIATPINRRRKSELLIAWRTAEAGCSKSTVKPHADIMKRPRPAASMRYSCQWARSAFIAVGEVASETVCLTTACSAIFIAFMGFRGESLVTKPDAGRRLDRFRRNGVMSLGQRSLLALGPTFTPDKSTPDKSKKP